MNPNAAKPVQSQTSETGNLLHISTARFSRTVYHDPITAQSCRRPPR